MEQQKLNQKLITASGLGNTETVKVLLEAGADVHVNNNYALRWAKENKHTEIIELLENHIKSHSLKENKMNQEITSETVKKNIIDYLKDFGVYAISGNSLIKGTKIISRQIKNIKIEEHISYDNTGKEINQQYFIFKDGIEINLLTQKEIWEIFIELNNKYISRYEE